MTAALHILKKYWKHTSFRVPQDKIIEAVLDKNDVIALLPTGGGKSICFQIPGLLQEGICIVISPLIALMQDQVDSLNNKGIKAIALTSGLSQNDMITAFDNLQFGNYKFLYLSPERLQTPFIQEKIKQLNVNLIAVDEAHCISEWGHDFRPSYRHIKILRTLQPNANFIALTASATKKVLENISINLELNNQLIFKKSFYRNNLAYQLFSIEDKLHRLLQIFTKTKSPAIVYVNSRNKTKEIAKFLTVNGFSASYYHGGLSANEKQEAFENWMSEKTPIMVATNAFGMGIDKDNVKVVVHLDLPTSVENYIQEAGRAGRNGKKSYAVMLQNKSDILVFKEKAALSFPTINELKEVYKKLHQHYQIAHGELVNNGFEFNLSDFSNTYNITRNKLNNALQILINNGVIELSNNYSKKSTLQFLASSSQVLQYVKNNSAMQSFVNTVLRSYGGIFEQETKINEYLLAKQSKITLSKVDQLLSQLHDEKLISYKKTNNNATLFFLVPREDRFAINQIAKKSTAYINQKKNKLEALVRFVENNETCRSIQVLHYFNEQQVSECGICDVCLSKKKQPKDLTSRIIELLKAMETCTSKEICDGISFKDEDVLVNLHHLLAENTIAINKYNQYYLK